MPLLLYDLKFKFYILHNIEKVKNFAQMKQKQEK